MKQGRLPARLLLIALAGMGCDAFSPAIGEAESGSVDIYAGKVWYQARAEKELRWVGVLEPREPAVGPNSRSSLHYTLVTDQGEFPVYAAGMVDLLQPFVGHRVTACGKLVDLSSEGFGPELWIGTIRR